MPGLGEHRFVGVLYELPSNYPHIMNVAVDTAVTVLPRCRSFLGVPASALPGLSRIILSVAATFAARTQRVGSARSRSKVSFASGMHLMGRGT